MVGFVVNR